MATIKGFFLGGQYFEIQRWCKCKRFTVAVEGDSCGMCKMESVRRLGLKRKTDWGPIFVWAAIFLVGSVLILAMASLFK